MDDANDDDADDDDDDAHDDDENGPASPRTKRRRGPAPRTAAAAAAADQVMALQDEIARDSRDIADGDSRHDVTPVTIPQRANDRVVATSIEQVYPFCPDAFKR